MAMEKHGRVDPVDTPDTERRLPKQEKQATGKARETQVRELDDDMTKRAADAVGRRLK